MRSHHKPYIYAIYSEEGTLATLCENYQELLKFFPDYKYNSLTSILSHHYPLYCGKKKYSCVKINKADL